MLLGAYDHTIDDKNRLTLPAKFREAFQDGVVVTRGLDGCLYAYRRPDWDRLVESRLATMDPLSQEGRRIQRFFFAGASEADLDKQGRVMLPAQLLEHAKLGREVVIAGVHHHKQGRVMLPPQLLEHAKLGREVVIAGVHDHLEIWNRAAWRKELAEVE